MKSLQVTAFLATSALASGQGVSIGIVNAGFEAPAIAADSFATTAPPPGWSGVGPLDFGARTIGVLNPGASGLYPLGVPEGQNCGVVFLLDNFGNQSFFADQPAGLAQTLNANLQASTRYRLSVQVGNLASAPGFPHSQFQFGGFPDYRVELLAGGQVIAADNNSLTPNEGEFELSVVELDVGGAHPLVGQPLGVRLLNLNAAPGIEVNFDAVELRAESIPAQGLNYCSAGTTTAGCAATLTALGVASASAASGFVLSANNVEGQRAGLLFYSVAGPNSAPWSPASSSVLCVKSPTQRMGVGNSGGNAGACDGALGEDWNAFRATHPGASGQPFLGGELVYAQAWFRDPPAPQSTNLSNARVFVVAP
jgi:hypothetical protein